MSVVKPDVVVISSDEEDGDDDYSESDGHESDEVEEDDIDKSNEEECVDNCDERLDRSASFNQGGNDLQELTLYECKTYLRKHGMRVSGTKEECMQRIKEHGRIKDGRVESLYPRSSFSINCTGDACKGDVVLFQQNVYNSQWNIIERRTVAGRILKESYGASTQQHTFSIEVLWSRGYKKLNPLSILLVKGRNLYRFGTFRQRWETEEERSKVLREKHERGKAARHKRNLRETELASDENKGTNLRTISNRRPSQYKRIIQIDKQNDVNKNTTAHNQASWFQNMELKSDNNNGEGHNQAFSQPPDEHHHNHEPPVRRSTNKMKACFPKSSFSISCTGDARNGDIVLFKQVYLVGNKVGKKRTVAGRIVEVRKCGSKDSHKFLIKVLWTTPSINNCRRFALLVRSRNLYKFGTFRQPWKNEAMRSKMVEDKHGQATRKRKLKTDIASNKNKGGKRQKVSYNGPSPSKQPTQIAKHKSSKRKDVNATFVKKNKTGHRRKPVQIQKTKVKKSKQSIEVDPNPNTNLNPSPSTNLDLKLSSDPIASTTSNPVSPTNLNLNLNPNTTQIAKHKSSKRKVAIATSIKKTKSDNKRMCVQFQKTKVKKSKQQSIQLDPNPNTNLNPSLSTNLDLNLNSCPILSTTSNPVPPTILNLNTTQIAKHKSSKRKGGSAALVKKTKVKKSDQSIQLDQNPNNNINPRLSTNLDLNLKSNPISSTSSNPIPSTNLNPNTCPNPNPNPQPSSCMYCTHQLQESSISLPYDTTFMPNHPPIGFSSNQPPVWYSPNQPQPFGFPGYDGHWGPNRAFIQPPGYYDYNQLIVCLLALLCQQPC